MKCRKFFTYKMIQSRLIISIGAVFVINSIPIVAIFVLNITPFIVYLTLAIWSFIMEQILLSCCLALTILIWLIIARIVLIITLCFLVRCTIIVRSSFYTSFVISLWWIFLCTNCSLGGSFWNRSICCSDSILTLIIKIAPKSMIFSEAEKMSEIETNSKKALETIFLHLFTWDPCVCSLAIRRVSRVTMRFANLIFVASNNSINPFFMHTTWLSWSFMDISKPISK